MIFYLPGRPCAYPPFSLLEKGLAEAGSGCEKPLATMQTH